MELDQKLNKFANLGVNAIAISGDSSERVQKSQREWNLQNLRLGYGLRPEDMRRWGLYISKGAYENEPALFNEPAIFCIKPDGILSIAMISTIPFARPHLDDLINGLDYILEHNHPIRGTEA